MKSKNVKLTIIQIESSERPITIYEDAIWNIARNGMPTGECSLLCERCKHEAYKIGLNDTFESPDGQTIGKFRTTSVRSATPEEVIAWYTLNSHYECANNMPIHLYKHGADYISPAGCAISMAWERAENILNDKKVILELVDE